MDRKENRARKPFARLSYLMRKLLEGSFARMVLVFVAGMTAVIAVSGAVFAVIGAGSGIEDPFWFSFLSLLGPDALFAVDERAVFARTVAAVLVAFGIIAFNGIVVAIVVTRLQREFEAIREGRGRIFERGHVVLLGWSNLHSGTLRGLETWCVTERRKLFVAATVSVADNDMVQGLPRYARLRLSHRTGHPQDAGILDTVSASTASCLVIQHDLFSPGDADESVRGAQAATAYISARAELGERLPPCVVSMCGDAHSKSLAPFLDARSRIFDSDRFVASYVATLCIEPRVYAALDEFLSFEGCELHFRAAAQEAGLPFGSVRSRHSRVIPVGIRHGETLVLLPKPDTIVDAADELVFLAPDEASCRRHDPVADRSATPSTGRVDFEAAKRGRGERRVVVIGTNRLAEHIRGEFLVAGMAVDWVEAPKRESGSYEWDTVTGLGTADTVLVLSDREGSEPASRDAETVFRCLSLLEYRQRRGLEYELVAEFLDTAVERAMSLVPERRFRWIVGTRVASEILAMAAIHRGHLDAFDDLLSERGTRLLEGTLRLSGPETMVSFGSASEALYAGRGVIPVGVFEGDRVTLNPGRNRILRDGDALIVLAPFDL